MLFLFCVALWFILRTLHVLKSSRALCPRVFKNEMYQISQGLKMVSWFTHVLVRLLFQFEAWNSVSERNVNKKLNKKSTTGNVRQVDVNQVHLSYLEG